MSKEMAIKESDMRQISIPVSSADIGDRDCTQASGVRPRVLLTVSDLGGAYRHREHLDQVVSRARRNGADVEFHAPDFPRIPFIDFAAVRKNRFANLVTLLCSLKRFAGRLARFDFVHVLQTDPVSLLLYTLPTVLIAKFFGKRVIMEYVNPVEFSRLVSRRTMMPRMWRLCHAVVVPTQYQQQVVNMFGANGRYVRPHCEIDQIQSRLVTQLQPRVVISGPLERESGVPAVIRSCRLVKQKYPRTELVIVGDGRLRSALGHLAESEMPGAVEFTGDLARSDRYRLFGGCDVFVNCSSIDYLSVAMVEAFASGLPVLSTPIPHGAVVLRDRENIVNLRFADHTALANRIIELIEDPGLTEKLSRSGPETARRICRDNRGDDRLGLYPLSSTPC